MSNNLTVAENYYKAIANKSAEMAAIYLDPNVVLLNPMAEVIGKEAVLKAASGFFTLFNSLKVRSKFSSGDQAMLVYDLGAVEPIGTVRTAALFTIKNELIVRLELFFDFRPFEKVIKS